MIKFTKFLSIFLFLLFSNNSKVYSFGATDEMLCMQWLNKIVLGKKCPENDIYCGKDKDVPRKVYHVRDEIGTKGICKDYFPSGLEREMFYRTSDNSLNMDLILVKQFCGWRWWDGTTNCGAPKWTDFSWKYPFGIITWAKGPENSDWTGEVRLNFSLQKRGPKNYQTVVWGLNYSYIDYEKTSDGKDNPKRICVFYATSWLSGIFTNAEKIGCLDIPLNPAPDIYNKIIVPKKSVVISDATPSDSTFIKPKINLQVIDSTGQILGGYTTLTYDFEDKASTCKIVNNSPYCAFVPPGEPTKICAGLKDNASSNIGCINRPRPTDSGIKIKAKYYNFIDNNCLDNSGKPTIFSSLQIQLLSNNKVIKELPEQNSGLRDYYACYRQNPNPNKDKIVVVGKDITNIYGVQFSAIIPKLISSSNLDVSKITSENIAKIRPENFKKTFIYPPIITSSSIGSSGSSCNQCFVPVSKDNCIDNNLTSKERGQSMCSSYITPAGKRDRTSCDKKYSCYNFKDNPPPIKNVTDNIVNCYFGSGDDQKPDDAYNDAEKAYCTGIYIINQQDKEKTTGPEKDAQQNVICMNLDTNWPNFYGKDDQICAEISGNYMKLDKNSISALTNYIDFTDDTFDSSKKYTEKEQLPGECDHVLGLENERCLSTDGQTCTKLPTIGQVDKKLKNEYFNFIDQYNTLQKYLYGDKNGINSNTLPADKNLLTNLGYSSNLLKKNFSTIIDPTKNPYRTLDGNFPIGTIHNSCRFIAGDNGCGKNEDTTNFLGHAIYDTTKLNIQIGSIFNISNANRADISIKLTANDIPVTGTCAKGFQQVNNESPPIRICRVIVNKDNNKIITKSWSDTKVINPCISDNQSNIDQSND